MVSSRLFGLAALCLCGTTGRAAAQEVRFSGSTTGCFFVSQSCTPKSEDMTSTLKFESGSFDGTTVDGKFQFGSATNNFGLFSLGSAPTIYDGMNFLLDISFSRPRVGGPDAVFEAAISGKVRAKPIGGDVDIDFDGSKELNFRSPDGSGRFKLSLDDMTVRAGAGHTPIGGLVDATVTTVTPEPATMTLLATGLAALIPAARRRRNKKS